MLEEPRKRIKEKKEEALKDPEEKEENKQFITLVDALFDDVDALSECHRSTLDYILYYIGYPLTDSEKIYDALMEEVKKTYTLVDPEMFEKALNHEESKTEEDE